MRRTTLLCLLIAFSLLSACTMRGPIAPDYPIQQKKIAVVSELGNHFQYVTVGTTVFTNNLTKADVSEWQINHLATTHLMTRLSQRGIQASEVASDFFTPLEDGSPHTVSTVQDKVISKVKAQGGYQALLLVRPTTSENHPFFRPGYGLHTRYFFGTPQSCIYAMYILELYDLEKNQSVGWDWVNANQGPCIMNSANDIPVKEDLNQFSPQEKQDIHQRLETWIKTSLDASLRSMQLAP